VPATKEQPVNNATVSKQARDKLQRSRKKKTGLSGQRERQKGNTRNSGFSETYHSDKTLMAGGGVKAF